MPLRSYVLDPSVRRHGAVVVGGSPLRLFRLTDAGAGVVDDVAAGRAVASSNLVCSLLDGGALHPVPGPDAPFGRDDVTVVVPALGAPTNAPVGALVVDDASDPPIAGAAVRLAINSGPGAARNAGLARVTTALVAFVDADVEVHDAWLDGLLPHFSDGSVVAVAPRVASTPGPGRLARHEQLHSPLDLGPERGRVRAGGRVGYVPAAAIVCRVDALRAVGGFDEGLRSGEDVDLVWRLDRAGGRVRYEPSVVVHHRPRSGWPGWLHQRISYGSSAAPLAIRHGRDVAPLRVSGWSLAAWLIALVRPDAGLAIAAGSSVALVRKLHDLPPSTSFGLAWRGHLAAGRQLGAVVRRAWWPIVAVAALRSTTARRALLASALAARSPLSFADDAAYSVGVWQGVVRHRTLAPLTPDITSWPGRRR